MKNKFEFELNQPKDFDSAHDSLELIKALDTVNKAKRNIQIYKEKFVESFLKTAAEVIKYIPENQWNKYTVCKGYIQMFNKPYVSTSSIDSKAIEYSDEVKKIFKNFKRADKRWNKRVHVDGGKYTSPPRISEKNAEIIKKEVKYHNDNFTKINNCKTLLERLMWINPKQKVFLVDTINKKIEILWGLEDPVDMHPISGFNSYPDFRTYISKNVDGEIIIASCRFGYSYYYSAPAAGAVMISGNYWNKTESCKSYSYKEIYHKFNMRNNKYEGVVKNTFIDGDNS